MSVANLYYAARVALSSTRDAETPLESLTWLMRAMAWRELARSKRAKERK